MNTRNALCLATLAVSAYLLVGCWDSRDKRQTHDDRAGTLHLTGQLATWPLDLTADYSGHSDGTTSGQRLSGIAPTPAESSLLGQILGLVGAGTGLGGIGLLIRNLSQTANMHRDNENEAWTKLLALLTDNKGEGDK